MPEPISYQLSTLKDIVDKVPADRIRTCMEELGILLGQAAASRDLFMQVAADMGMDPAGVVPKLPDFITWIDDDKGDLSLRVLTRHDGENVDVFTITTHTEPK